MREIKFRGKRVDNGEWVYGFLFKIWERTFILWGTTNGIPNMIEVIPETVEQYTGLKDKNGKEIYEGDVLHMSFLNIIAKGYIKFVDGCFDFVFKRDGREMREYLKCLTCNHCIEVIGNIHDNPELLR